MDDDEEYLEYRKRDPEFQKMVEEEMRRLTMELENDLSLDKSNFAEPIMGAKEKKQNVYSPKKPFSSVVDDDDNIPHESFAKREKQDNYARQLRQQEEYSKYSSNEPERVSLRSQRNRPLSPVESGTSILQNIGNFERSKQSPDVKRKQQEEYARQISESSKSGAVSSRATNSGRYPGMDSLDPYIASQGPTPILGSINGVRNNLPSTGGLNIGVARTDDEVVNEKRRKQAEYARQLDIQKRIDLEQRDGSRGWYSFEFVSGILFMLHE